MKYNLSDRVVREISFYAKKYGIEKVVLFGSRARGTNTERSDIYRTGIVGQFNLTFELAWKALQEVLRLYGAAEAGTGSPREILQLGYKLGFLEAAGRDWEDSASSIM